MHSLLSQSIAEMNMTKPCLKSLAGAAILLLLSGHAGSAESDGTCPDAVAASQDSAPDASAQQSPLDYTKVAQIALAAADSETFAAPARADAAQTPRPGKIGDTAKKQTDALPKER